MKKPKRYIITARFDCIVICDGNTDAEALIHGEYGLLGDCDEVFIEQTPDIVTEKEIDHAAMWDRLVEN